MNNTISPLEFLLVNAICFAGGVVTAVAISLAGKAIYTAGKRSAK
jgi:hypothetical protein